MTAQMRRALVRLRNRFDVGIVIGFTLLGIALLIWAVPRASAAEHPATTSDQPPGWQLQRALPGEEFRPRGRFFDNKNGCLLDLASDRYAMPSGTRLACIKIEVPR